MRFLTAVLLLLPLFLHNSAPLCEGIEGVQSPIHLVNQYLDETYGTFDATSPFESVTLISVLKNTVGTRYKIMFAVNDAITSRVKHYIGIQSEIREVNNVKKHAIIQFAQSGNAFDVSGLLKINFENDPSFTCTDLKSDFIAYYGANTSVPQWFSKFFKFENKNGAFAIVANPIRITNIQNNSKIIDSRALFMNNNNVITNVKNGDILSGYNLPLFPTPNLYSSQYIANQFQNANEQGTSQNSPINSQNQNSNAVNGISNVNNSIAVNTLTQNNGSSTTNSTNQTGGSFANNNINQGNNGLSAINTGNLNGQISMNGNNGATGSNNVSGIINNGSTTNATTITTTTTQNTSSSNASDKLSAQSSGLSSIDQQKMKDIDELMTKLKAKDVNDLMLIIQNYNTIINTQNAQQSQVTNNTSSSATNQVQSADTAQLSTLQQQLDAKNRIIEELKQQNEKSLRDIQSSNAALFAKLKADNDAALTSLKLTYDIQINELKKQKEDAVNEAIAKSNQEITNISKRKDEELNAIKTSKSAEFDALIQTRLSQLQIQLDQKQKELQSLQDDKATAISNLQAKNAAELSKIEQTKKNEIQAINDQRTKELKQMLDQKDAELVRIQKQKDAELQAEVDRKVLEYNTIIKQKDDAYNSAISKQNELLNQQNLQKELDQQKLIDMQRLFEQQLRDRQKADEANLINSTTITTTNANANQAINSSNNMIRNYQEAMNANLTLLNNSSVHNTEGDDFYINVINNMQFQLKRDIMIANNNSTTTQELYANQERAVANFINGLSKEQRKLIEDYLKELGEMFNSQPVSINSLTYDKILLILDQIRIQQEKKKREYEQQRNKLLQDYLDRINKQNSSSPIIISNNSGSPDQANGRFIEVIPNGSYSNAANNSLSVQSSQTGGMNSFNNESSRSNRKAPSANIKPSAIFKRSL